MLEFESHLIVNDINHSKEKKGIDCLKLLTYKNETVKKLNKGLKKVYKNFEASMLNRPDIELELKRRRENLKLIEESNASQLRYDFRKMSVKYESDKLIENLPNNNNVVAIDGEMFDLYKKINDNILDKLGNLKKN